MNCKTNRYSIAVLLLLCALTFTSYAQRIILDKPVKAGELTLFPDMEDPNAYYYLPDQLKLATDDNGKPQFSFLRYVENVRSAAGAEDIREGMGGGIVHAVIQLSVSPQQLLEAKSELRNINAGGVIQGPVIYSGGTLAIISSFANTEGDLTKQVVGIGKAPLIDGQRAAVSMELTKKGAQILWESFQTATPDMSFSFEMELEGYRSPKQAMIEADFEKIYNHHAFQLGASGNYNNIVFGGEIDLAFDELRNDGAIKVTNMDADENMESLIETAYNKLTTLMFDPIGGTGNPVMKDLVKSITGKKSPMDRATDLYKQNKGSTAKKSSSSKKTSMFQGYSELNYEQLLAFNGNYFPFETSETKWSTPKYFDFIKSYIKSLTYFSEDEKIAILTKIKNLQEVEFTKLKKQNIAKAKAQGITLDEWYDYQTFLTPTEFSSAKKLIKKDSTNIYDINKKYRDPRLKAIMNQMTYLTKDDKLYCDCAISVGVDYFVDYIYLYAIPHLKDEPLSNVQSAGISDLNDPQSELTSQVSDNQIQNIEDKDTPKLPPLPDINPESLNNDEGVKNIDQLQKHLDQQLIVLQEKNKSPKKEKPEPTTPSLKKDEKKDTKTTKVTPDKSPEEAAKKKALAEKNANEKKAETKKDDKKKTAKKEEKKSDFKLAVMASYQFKKMKQKGNFKINLNKHTADKLVLRFDENIGKIDCNECFLQVNLDDPLFKQREITAMVDGFNAEDFGKFINFVNVKLKKKHQSGETTIDEVRINRDNFVKAANNFKMLYGWKGDDNRDKWLDYEFQTQWSFFGGNEVEGQWQNGSANAINLAPPYLRRTIELEADPELLKESKVRSVSVKLFFKMGTGEEVQQLTMLPSRQQFSMKTDILLPKNTLEYDYEIIWRLAGNKTVSSGRQTTSEQILFVDEVAL